MNHAIVLRLTGRLIMLSCSCLREPGHAGKHGRAGRPSWGMIDMRPLFPAAEVVATWRAYHGWET